MKPIILIILSSIIFTSCSVLPNKGTLSIAYQTCTGENKYITLANGYYENQRIEIDHVGELKVTYKTIAKNVCNIDYVNFNIQ